MDELKNKIRIGYVSAVQREKGMVAVAYPDEDDATTDFLPFLSPGREFFPPEVNDMVVVVYTEISQAVVLGTYWNWDNIPPVVNGVQKNFGDDAYVRYDAKENTLTVHAPKIVIECQNGNLVINDTTIKGVKYGKKEKEES